MIWIWGLKKCKINFIIWIPKLKRLKKRFTLARVKVLGQVHQDLGDLEDRDLVQVRVGLVKVWVVEQSL